MMHVFPIFSMRYRPTSLGQIGAIAVHKILFSSKTVFHCTSAMHLDQRYNKGKKKNNLYDEAEKIVSTRIKKSFHGLIKLNLEGLTGPSTKGGASNFFILGY
jgi:hypothetical protein